MHPLPPGLSLAELAAELGGFDARIEGDAGVRVAGVHQDSRRVQPGDLFVARAGQRANGAAFVTEAVRRGATAVLADAAATLPAAPVPVLRVHPIERALSSAAETVYGHPSREVQVVGVTGTNGKTTVTGLLFEALSGVGLRAARLGTLGYACGEDRVEETLTTPAADDVTRFIARAQQGGASHLAMEVSSHALEQFRVDGVRFAVGAFTNLTQDHLDYHRSMEAYGRAKARLFDDLVPDAAVVFVDDPFGAALAARFTRRVLRCGRARTNDIHPADVISDARGIRGELRVVGKPVVLQTQLVGAHNLENLLVVLGIAEALGLDLEEAARALGRIPGVPGRLERCDGRDDDVLVLVDYAHTPDALRRALEAVRHLTAGSVVCVFGCGGDRDPDKRPQMGRAVGEAADYAIITNDNPRSEDPTAIAVAVEEGLRPTNTPYTILLDRASAIEQAIVAAKAGDVVLIAGKGHEPYQIVGAERRTFDDRVEAKKALAGRRAA